MRKGFKFIPMEQAVTPVYDAVSLTVPEQSLGLRELLMQFAYLNGEKLQEIVNRGFDGDEDDDILGVDVSQLDFAEVHDRMMDLQQALRKPNPARQVEPDPTEGKEQNEEAPDPVDADAKAL